MSLTKGLSWVLLFFMSIPVYSVPVYADFYQQQVQPVIARGTDQASLKIFLAGTMATLVARPNDDSIREQWVDHQKMDKDAARFGDLLGTGLPGLGIAFSQYFFFDQQGGINHLRALISTDLVTQSMKLAFGRNRPGTSHSHKSFPSGHTSTAFASATALSMTYGWKAAVIAYPLAAWTGASRLADDAHWFSDIVAGAFVGVWWARASVFPPEVNQETNQEVNQKANSARNQASAWNWCPIVTSQYLGANFDIRF